MTITFFFASSEVTGSNVCDNLDVFHWDGNQWVVLARDESYGVNGRICDANPSSIRVQGVGSFSPFILKTVTIAPVKLYLPLLLKTN